MSTQIHKSRSQVINDAETGPGPVVYWMSREQRLEDNWALIFAKERATQSKTPLYIVFCLVPKFLHAGKRQYEFMLRGLEETARQARDLNIVFLFRRGEPGEVLPEVLSRLKAGQLILETDPLRIKKTWKKQVLDRTNIRAYEVDARNIVPWWTASSKQEYAARTIRPKIEKLLPAFLYPFPQLAPHPFSPQDMDQENTDISLDLPTGSSLWKVNLPTPGPAAANRTLEEFIKKRLPTYHLHANDPNGHVQSNLSPYLHFGQISAQKAALRVREESGIPAEARQAFLEQLIVRRELAENFCAYNQEYDSLRSAPNWAGESLNKHARDPREHIYSLREFEQGMAHDPLWNAAQIEMLVTGRMHGYMRMYWAKKILEWTPGPETALEYAIYLNDRYQLDGRDPNGYTGIMWSIAGIHDQGWKERQVFGKVRYMSYTGCQRKFKVNEYIQRIKKYAQKVGLDASGLEGKKS